MSESSRPAWAQRLVSLRRARRWSHADAAAELKKIGTSLPSVISLTHMIRSDWETGRHRPGPHYRLLLSAIYEVEEADLFDNAAPFSLPDTPRTVVTTGAGNEWDDDMYRRAAIQLLAAVSAGAAIPADSLRTVLSGVERVLGDRADLGINDWEATVWEYGQQAYTAPVGALIGNLTADLIEVGRLLNRNQSPAVQKDLLRISAQLARYAAMELADLGDRRAARHVFGTALRAAEAAGDVEVSLWVLGSEASEAFWTGRPYSVITRLIDEAVRLAGNTPRRGLAVALETRAKLAATRGDEAGAHSAQRALTDVFSRLPDDVTKDQISPWGWPEERLWLNEGYVLALLGERQAHSALDQAIARYPVERQGSRRNLQLLRAYTLIQDREFQQGLNHAFTAVQGLPLSASRRKIAGQVLAALPAKARDLAEAQELRSLVSALAA